MTVAAEWETFYVIIGSSAAALTGLQFVVIALSADHKGINSTGPEAFATPTIVHFCSVLVIAAILSVPRQTPATLAICFGLEGLAGFIYSTIAAIRISRQTVYVPVLEDTICHVVLPLTSYATLFVSGVSVYRHEVGALYVIAATALLLLLTGIHNAWDGAVYIAATKRGSL
jgi:hypothetical protein